MRWDYLILVLARAHSGDRFTPLYTNHNLFWQMGDEEYGLRPDRRWLKNGNEEGTWPPPFALTEGALSALLHHCGSEGWELVSVTPYTDHVLTQSLQPHLHGPGPYTVERWLFKRARG